MIRMPSSSSSSATVTSSRYFLAGVPYGVELHERMEGLSFVDDLSLGFSSLCDVRRVPWGRNTWSARMMSAFVLPLKNHR